MGRSRAARQAEARVRQAQEDAKRNLQEAQGLRTGLRSQQTVGDFRKPLEKILPAGYTFDPRAPERVLARNGKAPNTSYSEQNDPNSSYYPQSQYGGPQAMGGTHSNDYPPQSSNIPQYYNPPPVQPVNEPRLYNPPPSQPLQPPQSFSSHLRIPNQSQIYKQLPPKPLHYNQSSHAPQNTPQYYNPPPSQPSSQPFSVPHLQSQTQAGSYDQPQSLAWRERTSSPPSGNSKDKLPQKPSKASGGIPDPTPEYMRISRLPTPRLKQAQHLLVIIDLNGTLLHRPNRKEPKKFIKRPHTDRFLNYCIDTFSVVIWSSAKPDNVRHMCANILTPEMAKKVVAIWGRDKFNLCPNDYNNKTQCYKRLTKIWEDKAIAASHPEAAWGKKWDQTNTVLIDDDNYKGRSEPFNLIEIPEFAGKLESETGNILPQVHDYLNKLSLHDNVSSYLRLDPWKAKDAAEGPPGFLKTGR